MGIHLRWTEGFIPLQTNVIFNWNFITLQQITSHWFVVQINPICCFYACSSDSFWSLEKSSQTSDFFCFLSFSAFTYVMDLKFSKGNSPWLQNMSCEVIFHLFWHKKKTVFSLLNIHYSRDLVGNVVFISWRDVSLV